MQGPQHEVRRIPICASCNRFSRGIAVEILANSAVTVAWIGTAYYGVISVGWIAYGVVDGLRTKRKEVGK